MRSPDPVAALDVTPPSPLIVHAGRSVLVATDALLAHLPELTQYATMIDGAARRTALVALDTPPGALRSVLERCDAAGVVLADRIRGLRESIVVAQSGYELVERAATWGQDAVSEWIAAGLGRLAPILLPGLVGVGMLVWNLMPGDTAAKKAAVGDYLLEHPELITSPEFSALVRRVVMGADDAALAAAGVPAWATFVLGDHGLGILGVDTSAAALVAVGTATGGRAMHETPVAVERVSERKSGRAPMSAEERLARVPDDAHVRIERYTAPGEPSRYIVYVAPTETFSPFATDSAWDLTSNIAGVGQLSSGSIRATEQAMTDAGITVDDEVVLVGFSQGGLVADAIAASGDWNTVGLETYGDPGGGFELPEGIRGVAARHTDDFVVATGGPQVDTDRLIVEREAYPDGVSIPTDLPAPAHQRRAYEETARLLDAATSPQVRAELDALAEFAGDYLGRDGGELTVLSYRAERTPSP